MRAISILSLLAGISTVSCDAWMALRTRVRKSATGSVMDMGGALLLPAALGHARDVAVVRELAQADPAQAELAEHGARAAAAAAARVRAGLVLGGARLTDALGKLGHELGGNLWSLDIGVALAAEGHAEGLEQRVGLAVGRGRRRDGDVEPADLVDLVVVDLGEDDLLADPEVVVAPAVEGARRQSAEVADPGDRDGHEPVEELVGALAAERHRQADGHLLAHLELRDRLARAADVRLLAGDRAELLARGVEDLRVLLGVADAHVQRDLEEARRLHRRRVAEALDERRADLLEVALLEAGVGLRCLSSHGLVEGRPGPGRPARAGAALAADADARGLLVLGIDEHDVGDVDRAFLLDHAADRLGPLRPANLLRALMALHDIEALDVDPLLLGVHAQDHAGLAAVLAADDDHLVVAADLRCVTHARAPPARG